MSEPIVKVEDLQMQYRTRRGLGRRAGSPLKAVDGVSLVLAEGESVGVVGESGSGKSTLARLITGIEVPTAGRVEVCGNERGVLRPRGKDRRRWGRELQIVFQDPYASLDPSQRVSDGIEEVLRLHFVLTQEERRRRAGAILDQVGLGEKRGHQLPRALSGGERQRAAIARAMAAEPRVLIFDEALSALDVSIQAQILNLLVDLREETGVAYLFLSHDLSVVRYIADRIVVMRLGRVVEEGTTEQVLSTPKAAYTRALLASVPRPGWKPQRIGDLNGGSESVEMHCDSEDTRP